MTIKKLTIGFFSYVNSGIQKGVLRQYLPLSHRVGKWHQIYTNHKLKIFLLFSPEKVWKKVTKLQGKRSIREKKMCIFIPCSIL